MGEKRQKKWNGMRVVIIGAARQGTALARYLVGRGARVIISDRKSEEDLENAMIELSDLPVSWVLGEHPHALLNNTDMVCISGGVPLSLPLVEEAIERKIPISNDSQIFLEDVTCENIIGITGSAGKTTTTSLVGEISKKSIQTSNSSSPYKKSWVGGNIGKPMISVIDNIEPNDLVIMELSSFQLEIMNISPWLAAILNITPNHLDRHKTMEAYSAAKEKILAHQGKKDIAVLNRDDQESWKMKAKAKGRVVSFGKVKDSEIAGSFLMEGWICFDDRRSMHKVLPVGEIRLRGDHNVSNLLAATAISYSAGLQGDSIRSVANEFIGVAHRLEFIRKWGGAAWYNDSIATAPERTLAAIRSFEEPIILLAGGRDKNLPWKELLNIVLRKVRYLVLFGEAAEKIEKILDSLPGNENLPRTTCRGLEDAVKKTATLVRNGDVVLLSPGGTSFDEFEDFEERGECFRKWVWDL